MQIFCLHFIFTKLLLLLLLLQLRQALILLCKFSFVYSAQCTNVHGILLLSLLLLLPAAICQKNFTKNFTSCCKSHASAPPLAVVRRMGSRELPATYGAAYSAPSGGRRLHRICIFSQCLYASMCVCVFVWLHASFLVICFANFRLIPIVVIILLLLLYVSRLSMFYKLYLFV